MRQYISEDDQTVIFIALLAGVAALGFGVMLARRGHWIWAILLFLLALFCGAVAWVFATLTIRLF